MGKAGLRRAKYRSRSSPLLCPCGAAMRARTGHEIELGMPSIIFSLPSWQRITACEHCESRVLMQLQGTLLATFRNLRKLSGST